MPEGPFGGPRPFASDERKVLVLLGIDGPTPPREIRVNMQEYANAEINTTPFFSNPPGKNTVHLNVMENPSREQKQELGPGVLHVQQYEVNTEMSEVSQKVVNAIHNEIVDVVKDSGFNITGTKTTVV